MAWPADLADRFVAANVRNEYATIAKGTGSWRHHLLVSSWVH